MAVYHQRQVAPSLLSMLSIGVVVIGLTLRLVTGRTDHGSVVFVGAILAIFAAHQLTVRCPRCGVSLAKADRKRSRDGWPSSAGRQYWRLLQCPECGVRLRKTR